ncbi:hypothetical protein ACQEV4_31640 [Streptomyces shenzhenensis]
MLNPHIRHVDDRALTPDGWSLRAENASHTKDLAAARTLIQ